MTLVCVACGRGHEDDLARYRCAACGHLLEVRGDFRWEPEGSGVWRYRSMLPVPAGTEAVTLGEGGTPLVAAPRLARWAGVRSLHLKVEAQNPTGSFKDRGMTAAVTLARARGVRALLCASTGNTSASLAAYAARAGIVAAVLVPKGRIARGKMSQALAFGARILEVEGTFDEALAAAETLAEEDPSIVLMNSVNPWRLEGQKTLPFEVVETLRGPPDVLAYPYGNGGNVSAGWKGLREMTERKVLDRAPRLLAVEAEDRAGTLASAIRIGRAVNEEKAARAIRDSEGVRLALPDAAFVEAQGALARMEGVFVEPASAASVAGLRSAVAAGRIGPSTSAVAVLTGSGLKDPDAAGRLAASDASQTSGADVGSLRQALRRMLG